MFPQTYPYSILSAGIGLIPVQYKDKRPDAKLLPKDDNGQPTWQPFKTQLPSQDDLARWFITPHNYGVVTGWRGLLVLDFDDSNEYARWRMWAVKRGGLANFAATSAFQVQSSRGVHVYLRCETPGANRKIGKIDVKFRGYVLGPGSIHPTGVEYKALKDAFILPLIATLSDVLPAEMLQHTELPQNINKPMQLTSDPWKAAMEPPVILGNGVVDKIKKLFRVEELFTNLKSTSRDSRWQMTNCPFHDDKHPSFWLDTQQQICGCHAGCTVKPLDVIGLYARLYGMTNGEAIRVLAKMV